MIRALQKLHQTHFHCDIKLKNFVFNKKIEIIDFGSAVREVSQSEGENGWGRFLGGCAQSKNRSLYACNRTPIKRVIGFAPIVLLSHALYQLIKYTNL